MIDIEVSDHQLIYCTRKVSYSKTNGHKQIKMRSLKNDTIDAFHLLLSRATFPNYELFADVNAAYSDFINKLMSIINQIAPFKEVCVKNRTEELFDGEVAESIKNSLGLPSKNKSGSKICLNENGKLNLMQIFLKTSFQIWQMIY